MLAPIRRPFAEGIISAVKWRSGFYRATSILLTIQIYTANI
jgi:hypothetical protein